MKAEGTEITDRRRSFLQLSFAVLIWSSSFAITKYALKEIPPVLFAFLRFIIACAVLLLLCSRKKWPNGFLTLHFRSIIWLALTGITLYYLLFNLSFYYTSASIGAMIQGFIPVAVVILAVIFLKEKINKWQILGIVVSVTGVVLMAYNNKPTADASSPLIGNLFMIASVFLWAAYTVIAKRAAHADAIWLTTCSTVMGTILMIPPVVIESWGNPFPNISPGGWLSIVYLGVFASALSFYWYNNAMKTLKASSVGAFLNLDPVIGAAIAIVFLGEPVLLLQLAGAALVLAGVWLSTAKASKN